MSGLPLPLLELVERYIATRDQLEDLTDQLERTARHLVAEQRASCGRVGEWYFKGLDGVLQYEHDCFGHGYDLHDVDYLSVPLSHLTFDAELQAAIQSVLDAAAEQKEQTHV